MGEWFEDEQFWRDTFPFMFPQERLDATPGEIESLLSLTGITGGRILDLCCGPGRHSMELAERGFTVTGVDRTPFLLDKARGTATDRGLDIEWVSSDMRDFRREGEFDLTLSMFTSFGYFDDCKDDIRVLENVIAGLVPGGIFVMETMGKERLAKIFLPTTTQELDDGSLLVQRHEIIDDWTRIRNHWILVRDDTAKHHRFHHTMYSGRELTDRLEGVGFTDVRLFGDLEGSPYGSDALRLVAVSRKP